MKKITSIVLCFVIMFASVIASSIISANGQTFGNNLLSNADTPSWVGYRHNKVIEKTADSRYGGEAILNKTIAYQNLYTAIETVPDKEYTIKFSVKANAINRIEIFAVPKGAQIPFGSSALDSKSSSLVTYKAYKGYSVFETEWTDISVKFETVSTENVQYYMNILFGAKGTTNTATISDFSLSETIDEPVVTPPEDPTELGWQQYRHNKVIEKTTDSRYGGEAILNKTIAHQNLYTAIKTVPDKEYTVKFSVKVNAINRIEIFAVPKGVEVPFGSSALDSKSSSLVTYKAYKGYAVSETEWTDISIEFETVSTEDVQYYINILFGAGGTTNTATISDFSLSETIDEPVVTPPEDPTELGWQQYRHNKVIEKTTDSRYGGEAILNKTIAHQNLYTAIETVPDKEYTIKFSVKVNAINRIEIFAVPKGAEVPFGSSALDSKSSSLVTYKAYKGYAVLETEWTDISIEFETVNTEDAQYYINILFGDGGTTNTATISDFSLSETIDEPVVTPPEDPTKLGWQQYRHNKVIEKTADSRYGGEAILNKTIAHQNLYTAIKTLPDKEYTIKFSVKVNAINRIEIFAVPKGGEVPFGSSALDSKSSSLVTYKAYKGYAVSETEWTDIYIQFETVNTEDVQYYINILFGDGGTTNTATVSDFSLVEGIDPNMPLPVKPLVWQQYQHNKIIEKTTDSHYGGEAILNKTVAFQNLYKRFEVETNATYKLSFSVKANEILRYEIFSIKKGTDPIWASGANINQDATTSYISFLQTQELSIDKWTDFSFIFTVNEDAEENDYYFNIHFGDGGKTNVATISDLKLEKMLPGYLNDTELSYCEDFYNEAFQNPFASGINTKTVIKIPVQNKKIYNAGINVSGNGRAVLSFDKEGTNIIKELTTNGKREGFSFLSHHELSEIYLVLEPETTLSYKDLYVFVQKAVSLGSDMGKAENPNLVKAPVYLSNAEIEAFLKNSSLESDDYQSPATGDSQNPLFAFVVLLVSIFLTFLFVKPKSKNNKKFKKEVV